MSHLTPVFSQKSLWLLPRLVLTPTSQLNFTSGAELPLVVEIWFQIRVVTMPAYTLWLCRVPAEGPTLAFWRLLGFRLRAVRPWNLGPPQSLGGLWLPEARGRAEVRSARAAGQQLSQCFPGGTWRPLPLFLSP